ncbi:conserved exported protein of unknown function [Pseudorhizobium banfieldiae]|uniref:Lipoprotein n=1 Tax=Pseudorhizobium banfieldiae TaxID=1125847 RepID=L0NG25_9HYPH|nr:hypothetical protein [Pseudorhizobium banfieldiae]CAD6614428.1 hypothetical protein RNT25_02670 [arsenite-oxidising bacterium NT-25]CCF20048.1 conserved exported protein of unknown function [Pseudorhizobium banfieldiae]
MRLVIAGLVIALSSAILAGCTTDALTPPADVGGGLRPSTPVTQAEADRLARTPDPQDYGSDTYGQQPRQYPPQNTLEAQAQALQSGASPAASSPPVQQRQQAEPAAAPAQPAPQAVATQGSVRFLPIIGAPLQAVTPLSRQLGTQARASGLTIRASGDSTTDHILKGYFSAFADGEAVTVVYVWDILDNSGGRLHRVQGQERIAASPRGDPWSAVPTATMETIATKTINEYVAWKNTRPG